MRLHRGILWNKISDEATIFQYAIHSERNRDNNATLPDVCFDRIYDFEFVTKSPYVTTGYSYPRKTSGWIFSQKAPSSIFD